MNEIHVGLVGLVSAEQVAEAVRVFNGLRKPYDPVRLLVGAKTTYEIVAGVNHDNDHVYPSKSVLPSLFGGTDYTKALYYAGTDMPSTFEDLCLAIDTANGQTDVIVFDGYWPSAGAITFLRSHYPELKVVFRMNDVVIKAFCQKLPSVVDRLLQYEGIVSGLLLDQSVGCVRMDPLVIHPLINRIRERVPKISVSVGGLDSQNIFLMRNLWHDFWDISIEADCGLRHWGMRNHAVAPDRVNDFLTNFFAVRYGG